MNYLVVLSIRGMGFETTLVRERAAAALRKRGGVFADPLRDDVWEMPNGAKSQDIAADLQGILRMCDEARFYMPMRRGVLDVCRQQGGVR